MQVLDITEDEDPTPASSQHLPEEEQDPLPVVPTLLSISLHLLETEVAKREKESTDVTELGHSTRGDKSLDGRRGSKSPLDYYSCSFVICTCE